MTQKSIWAEGVIEIVKEVTGVNVKEEPSSHRTVEVVNARTIAALLLNRLGITPAESAAAIRVSAKTVRNLLYASDDRLRSQGLLFRHELKECERKAEELAKENSRKEE